MAIATAFFPYRATHSRRATGRDKQGVDHQIEHGGGHGGGGIAHDGGRLLQMAQRELSGASSDAGLHTWDDKLTDYSPKQNRGARATRPLAAGKSARHENRRLAKNDRIDWILFRAQLESADFQNRVLKSEQNEPADVCRTNARAPSFRSCKKEYDTPRKRAWPRRRGSKPMPGLLKQGLSEFAGAGKTLCRAGDSIRARHRSALQREFDGARCWSRARRAR